MRYIVFAIMFCLSFEAFSYNLYSCHKRPLKWTTGSVSMGYDWSDFPDGSLQRGIIEKATQTWNSYPPSYFQFSLYKASNVYHYLGNYENEIYFTNISDTAVLGETQRKYDCFRIYTKIIHDLKETDIRFNGLLGWHYTNYVAIQEERLGTNSMLDTALHEFGHVISLDHNDSVPALMNEPATSATFSFGWQSIFMGYDRSPLADDLAGLRARYPSNVPYNRIIPLTIYLDTTGTQPPGTSWAIDTSTTSLKAGDSFSMRWGYSNLGTSNATFDVRFFISPAEGISNTTLFSNAWMLLGFDRNIPAGLGASESFTKNLTIPSSLPPGKYWVGFHIEPTSFTQDFGRNPWQPVDEITVN